jgi:hypothetical protein
MQLLARVAFKISTHSSFLDFEPRARSSFPAHPALSDHYCFHSHLVLVVLINKHKFHRMLIIEEPQGHPMIFTSLHHDLGLNCRNFFRYAIECSRNNMVDLAIVLIDVKNDLVGRSSHGRKSFLNRTGWQAAKVSSRTACCG